MEWLRYMSSSQTVRTRYSLAASGKSVTSPFGAAVVRAKYDVAIRVVFIGNVVMRNAKDTVSSMMVSLVLSAVDLDTVDEP